MPEEPQDITPNPVDNSQDTEPQPYYNQQIDTQEQASPQPAEPIFSQPSQVAAPISESMADQANSYYTSPKKSKKFLPKGIIIALITAVLFGGGSYAAYSWYQNPQKVLTDSLLNAFTAKASVYTATLTSGESDNKVSVDITVKQPFEKIASLEARLTYTYQGENFSLKGAVQNDSAGNAYVKFEQLADLLAKVKTEYGSMLTSAQNTSDAVDKFVEKIDGKWIKISATDLSDYSDEASKTQTCSNDAIKKLQTDKTQLKEVTDVYNKNQFIIISKQVGLKNSKYDFILKSDNAKAKSFISGLQDTKIYKALHECNGSFTLNQSDVADSTDISDNGTVEVWIDMWSHQLTKIDIESKTGSTKTSFVITPQFNQKFKIDTPSSSITLKQLESYITDITDAYAEDMKAYSESYDYEPYYDNTIYTM